MSEGYSDLDVKQLLLQINQAFADIEIPSVRVAPHHCEECDQLVLALQGRPRETLTQAETGIFGDAQIHLFAPEAIHYYFPNILAKALDPDEYNFLLDVLYFLSSSAEEHTGSQVSLFDDKQKQAVYQFLTYTKDQRQAAVENYGYDEELTQALKNWTLAKQPAT